MSRTFSFQPQFERVQELLPAPARPEISRNGQRPGLDLEALTREERVKLVQRLFLLPGPQAPHLVLFCSVESGAGTTWICAHAAETLASQVEGSVCLVDANLRTPFLHEYFGLDNLYGLSEALLQSRPIRTLTHQINGDNLWLVTSGSSPLDPSVLLTSDRLRGCLVELRAEFDYVLVDGPPAILYADTALLGKLADGVVLVVRANSTRREAAKKAAEILASANVRLMGAVLNKRTFPIPEALYRKL
jgi:capsular exopolysaccharide synthesis family protein